MKKLTVIIIILLSNLFAQDFRTNASRSIFSDYKAARIGDAITIIVVESSEASNQAQTSAGRSSDVGLAAGGSLDGSDLPSVDFSLGANNEFRGGGSTKSSGMVKTKISAMIDSVYSNGLLRISGSRKIVVNGEEQIIKIKGIVRNSDINSDNMVYSYNISDAEIIFEGNGMIDSNTEPGWLTKLFHWLF
jgi:flagellar L-ring protein precursor FlgH